VPTIPILRFIPAIGWFLWISLCCGPLYASGQQIPVSVQIDASVQKLEDKNHGVPAGTNPASNVVVWLSPLDYPLGQKQQPHQRPRLTQRNKTFEPHLLVVEVGTVIDFPNRDPFFHNVFSLFDGKRFDLGLYEAGATNSAQFDRVGVSFLFCNIHPEMSAVVVAVNTPYYAISDRSGLANFTKVPKGRYEMHVWSERGVPEDLKNQTRAVIISDAVKTLPPIHIAEYPDVKIAHKNKYGQDYIPPPEKGYAHP
jgi:plastocyanin